ncbi:MAG TPA: hypothetical protein DFR83_09170, partial [Deltaproteobacteria bacterium]|nr:hypothetical protein [Deltaproteobacteria bacterium]
DTDDTDDTAEDTDDTAEDTGDTGDPVEPELGPWPAESDDITAGGDMPCDNLFSPCNHHVRLAVGTGDGTWTLVPTPVATRASVPHAMIIDHGDIDGERWRSLWLTYVDIYPGNIPDGVDVENLLTTAILPFPDSAVSSTTDLVETLDTGGPLGWIRKRTDTWKYGYRIVDPDREMFADGPIISSLADVHHAMLVIDLDLDSDPANAENKLYLIESIDGFTFDFTTEVEIGRVGTDPDCYPLQNPISSYPAVLSFDFAPGGTGEWGCNVSGYQEFSRYEGSLFEQTGTGDRASGITVTSTTAADGQRTVYGHVDAEDATTQGQTDLVRTIENPDGTYTDAVVVTDADDFVGAENGIHAPTVLKVDDGLELLIFHTYIETPE